MRIFPLFSLLPVHALDLCVQEEGSTLPEDYVSRFALHSGPSHCPARHCFAITASQRAPPPTRVRGWTRLREGTPFLGAGPPPLGAGTPFLAQVPLLLAQVRFFTGDLRRKTGICALPWRRSATDNWTCAIRPHAIRPHAIRPCAKRGGAPTPYLPTPSPKRLPAARLLAETGFYR